jgi:hypothetical protein
MVVGRYVKATNDQSITRAHKAGLLFSLCLSSLLASTHAKANEETVIAKHIVALSINPAVIYIPD